MPRTPEAARARPLREALAALPLDVGSIACELAEVRLASYPGGARPTSTVRLGEGRGECVAWTAAAHEAFRARLGTVPRGRWRLGEWAAAMAAAFAEPYERAALEAAAIDCALRQRGTTVFGLIGVEARPVRYVLSFEEAADPVARAQREAPGVELKIDAVPSWDDGVYAGLAALRRIAVLDFKGKGRAADHERAHEALPGALLEDPGGGPWSASLRARLSFDERVTSAAALDGLPATPAAVNVKPARMGGVLEALDCVARCAERGIGVYLGGMFEVGVGRKQLGALAALLCPDASNDIAPLVTPDAAEPERPLRLVVDAAGPGFGA